MGDVKDILGVSRGAAPPAEKPEKAKGPRLVKPKGMSREAFALLSASHPLAPAELMEALAKGAAKAGSGGGAAAAPRRRGQVAYRWLPFDNPARGDGLRLSHWVKCYLDPATGAPAPAEAGHAFAKYAKGAPALRYDDEEWGALVAPDPAWSRAETDYLLDLVERLDARWLAVADRYDFAGEGGGGAAASGAAAAAGAGAGAAGGSGADGAAAGAGAAAAAAPAPARDLEDLKARYYAVARQLVVGRAGGPEGVANHALVKHPFSAERERQRKRGLELLLARAPAEDAAEDAVLAEAAKVEAKRRAEAGARGRGGGGAAAGAGGLGGGKDAAAAAAVAAVEVPEVAAEPPVGTPPLFDARGEPALPAAPAGGGPPPRVAARAAAVREIVDAALAAGDPADRQQRALLGALAELKMSELPRAATRQVCGAYLALLREVAEHLALKRELAARQALAAAGGGVKREAREGGEGGEGGEEGGDEPAGKRQRTARRAYDD